MDADWPLMRSQANRQVDSRRWRGEGHSPRRALDLRRNHHHQNQDARRVPARPPRQEPTHLQGRTPWTNPHCASRRADRGRRRRCRADRLAESITRRARNALYKTRGRQARVAGDLHRCDRHAALVSGFHRRSFFSGDIAGVAVGRWVVAAPVPIDRTLRIAAGCRLLAAAGVALAASARIGFLRTGQSVIPWTPTPELIFQGPYRFTRNPMYVGMTLLTIGLGVALNNCGFRCSLYRPC